MPSNLQSMSTTRLLLVEDAVSLQRSLGTGSVDSGFVVDQTRDGAYVQCFASARGCDLTKP